MMQVADNYPIKATKIDDVHQFAQATAAGLYENIQAGSLEQVAGTGTSRMGVGGPAAQHSKFQSLILPFLVFLFGNQYQYMSSLSKLGQIC